ncbi:hypothetical protein N9L19_00005 [bacterium]|nr:hypothetical protein [bacterium]
MSARSQPSPANNNATLQQQQQQQASAAAVAAEMATGQAERSVRQLVEQIKQARYIRTQQENTQTHTHTPTQPPTPQRTIDDNNDNETITTRYSDIVDAIRAERLDAAVLSENYDQTKSHIHKAKRLQHWDETAPGQMRELQEHREEAIDYGYSTSRTCEGHLTPTSVTLNQTLLAAIRNYNHNHNTN